MHIVTYIFSSKKYYEKCEILFDPFDISEYKIYLTIALMITVFIYSQNDIFFPPFIVTLFPQI